MALDQQRTSKKRLGEVLIELDIVTERQILEVLEYQLKIPFVDLNKYEIDEECPLLINEAMARRHQILRFAGRITI